MNLTDKQKIDLLMCICTTLIQERQRYSLVYGLTEEKYNEFKEEFKVPNLDRDVIKNNINRLEELKNIFKEDIYEEKSNEKVDS